jgi:integrase/recombinase XerD
MPLPEWPKEDRAAWEVATQVRHILDDPGLAAHWRPETKRSIIAAYGRYLTFLNRNGWLDEGAGPEARLTKDWVRAYLTELKGQIASVTLASRIRGLAEALRVLTRGAPVPVYLSRARYRLKARARPSRNKRSRLVPTQQLYQLGLDLMERAETGAFERDLWRACTYRDGIVVVILAMRAIRRSNLAGMRLGLNLIKIGDCYHLSFEGSETKNHRDYERPLHASLTPYIDRYLTHYRRILLGSREDDHVWISWRNIPMSDASLYGKIIQHTAAAFGLSLSPHLFRDAATTTLGEEDPELVWLSMSLLHHSDPRIAQKHYNHARDSVAVRQHQGMVLEQRRKMRLAARRSGTSKREAEL